MNATALSVGGLLLALLIFIANAYPWWKGGREFSKIAAFCKGALGGVLSAACPGGILGWSHAHAGTISNGAGETVGQGATGTNPTQRLTTGQLTGLGITGAFVVVLAVFVIALVYKAAGKNDRRRILGGAYVGTTLCLTAGVAGALAWLPGALNGIGQGIVDFFQGGGLL